MACFGTHKRKFLVKKRKKPFILEVLSNSNQTRIKFSSLRAGIIFRKYFFNYLRNNISEDN